MNLAGRFLRRGSSAAEARELVRALLRRDLRPAPPAESVTAATYAPMLDRLHGRLGELQSAAASEREWVRQKADELEAAAEGSRLELCSTIEVSLAERLMDEVCDRSQQQGARDPTRALQLALLTKDVMGGVESRMPTAKAADLRAQSFAQIGNALRVAGDFPAASAAFESAKSALGSGSGDPARGGFVCGRWAALLADESRFEEALSTTRKAGRLFRAAGLAVDRSRALILEATVLFYLDRVPEAVKALDRAADLLAGMNQPRLALALTLNRASYVLTLGDLAAAARGIAAARRLASELANPLDAPRVAWVEAQLQAEEGRLSEAESELRTVRTEFLRLALPHEVALVTLEMALVVARQGRFAEAGNLALEALRTFESLRVRPEALASLRLALDAARGEAARVEFLRVAIRRLRR